MELLIVWLGINFLLIFFGLLYIHGKWIDVKDLRNLDPIEAVVTKSEMTGDKNVVSNFVFEFSYSINGDDYPGYMSTIGLHDFKAFTAKHPVGSKMEIYVSPRKPYFVMHSKPSAGSILLKIITPLFLILLVANYFILAFAPKKM